MIVFYCMRLMETIIAEVCGRIELRYWKKPSHRRRGSTHLNYTHKAFHRGIANDKGKLYFSRVCVILSRSCMHMTEACD